MLFFFLLCITFWSSSIAFIAPTLRDRVRFNHPNSLTITSVKRVSKLRDSFIKTRYFSSNNDEENYYVDPYTSDEFFSSQNPNLTKEEEQAMIESMKAERVLNNDRWQSSVFKNMQCGDWEGSFELYQPVVNEKGFRLIKAETGTLDTLMKVTGSSEAGYEISVQEAARVGTQEISGRIFSPMRSTLFPPDFRPLCGNQVVGDAMTLAWPQTGTSPEYESEDVPEEYMAEIGVCDGPMRVRVRFLYSNGTSLSSPSPSSSSSNELFALSLAGILVIRESRREAPAMDILPLLDTSPGPSIYDPQINNPDYITLSLSGRLSLQFPQGLRHPTPITDRHTRRRLTTLCMQWDTRKLRIQADRKFTDLSPAVSSLEVTEISIEDADKYVVAELPPDTYRPSL